MKSGLDEAKMGRGKGETTDGHSGDSGKKNKTPGRGANVLLCDATRGELQSSQLLIRLCCRELE